jgi:hypothetical protein
MVYVYKNGILSENISREDAIEELKNSINEWKEVDAQKEVVSNPQTQFRTGYTQTPYIQYSHTYEAVLLYIVKKCAEIRPNFANFNILGKVFTLSMLKYYSMYNKPYTKEKPIKAGRIKQYRNKVGFLHFKEYFENCKLDLKQRTHPYNDGKKRAIVYWTELPINELKNLVDDRKMVGIINDCARYMRDTRKLEKAINDVFNRLPARWKLKK